MKNKVTNDAVAQVKTMAEKRGRNAEWAERAIREAVSITETEALELNVVNFIAPTVDSLLTLLDGKTYQVDNKDKTLSTKNARVEYIKMNLRYRILEKVTDPNIAYILMMVGIYGIFFELWNPGTVFPGVVGAISLILAFYAFQTLPINYAGLLLMLVAVVLFILEIKITSFGLLTIGGIIAMILGSLMLIDQPPELEPLEGVIAISKGLIITMVLLTTGFFTFAVGMAVRTHRKKVTTGSEGLVGEIGKALTEISPETGRVQVHGEIWTASSSAPIAKGDSVRVVEVYGLRIRVEKA
jgi:membrane-bound serine protease (ClpP class)